MLKFRLKYNESQDIITNGDFADGATGWTYGNGVTFGTGKAVWDGVYDEVGIYQSGVIAGEEYEVEFTISGYVAGALQVRDGDGNVISPLSYNADQVVSATVTPLVDGIIQIYGINNFEGAVDDVSVVGLAETVTDVTPLYNSEFSLTQEKEAEEVFFRKKLSGTIKFIAGDYDLIEAIPLRIKMTLVVRKFISNAYTDYAYGEFFKTDCKFEPSAKRVTVTLQAGDPYDKVIAAMDKEMNILDLSLQKIPIKYHRRPIFQFYRAGDTVLTNYSGGVFYEQETLVIDTAPDMYINGDLEDDYIFENCADIWIEGTGDAEDATQFYRYSQSAGKYISMDELWEIRPASGWQLWEVGATEWVGYTGTADPWDIASWFINPALTATVASTKKRVFARVLCNKSTIWGNALTCSNIPTSDIVEANENYSKVSAYYPAHIVGSKTTQVAETPYGRVPDGYTNAGQYYVRPQNDVIPISQSEWTDMSIWFKPGYIETIIETTDAQQITLRDAYRLPDVIGKMLEEADAEVQHQISSTYSEFLHGTSSIGMRHPNLFITPKSNIITSGYDQAATIAKMKLRDAMNLLAYAYRAFWYVDDGKFIIEHIAFFNNSYYYPNIVGPYPSFLDITTRTHPQHLKSWGSRTEYSYVKPEMPERIELTWGDKVSQPFEGKPIIIREPYVQTGNIEKRDVAMFMPDLDYCLATPSNISKQGFVVFDCDIDGTDYVVPMEDITIEGMTVSVQNTYLSAYYLLPQYHVYDLPGSLVTINGVEMTASDSISRFKMSEETFPLYPGEADPDVIIPIKTGVGTGIMKDMTVNLSKNIVTCTVLYETES